VRRENVDLELTVTESLGRTEYEGGFFSRVVLEIITSAARIDRDRPSSVTVYRCSRKMLDC